MSNYGLTRAELNEMDRIINMILSHQTNVTDTVDSTKRKDEVRARTKGKVIFPKQKLAKIRYYFDSLPREQLTNEELEIIKSIVVKPKSTEWNIVRLIITSQKSLSDDDKLKWFNYIQPSNRNAVYSTVIGSIQNEDFRFEAFKGMLTHANYIGVAFDWIDRLPGITEELKKRVMNHIFDLLDKNDTFSKDLVRIWSMKSDYMERHMQCVDRYSILLYNEFKEDIYLPKAAKDIFIF